MIELRCTKALAGFPSSSIFVARGSSGTITADSALNAGVLEHWNYDTFRAKLGDGREGWTPIGFTLGLDGSIAGLMLGSPGMTFTRDRAPAK